MNRCLILRKIKDYINLKKYKKFNIPIKSQDEVWNYKCFDNINKKEFIYKGNILNVMSDYCQDNLIFYFCYGNIDKLVKDKDAGKISHEHSFDDVIKFLYEYPETFYIRDDCKKFYSETELNFLNKLQEKLLKDGLKDIGKLYKEHPKKTNYEMFYIEYDYEELKKRNIKKIYGMSLNKHKKSSN